MTSLNQASEQRPSGAAVSPIAIELIGINKHFGPVHANRDIHLQIKRGTVHGIVGENGAGKSTLMSILYGFYTADSGEIRVGAYADAVVFDAAAIADTATFERPKATAVGIDCVVVNGQVAYRRGDDEPRRHGRFLARQPRAESGSTR